MKSKILFIFLIILQISCASDSEKMAIEQVSAFYGGTCEMKFGFETKNATRINYTELILKNSNLLNNDQEALSWHAGNAAYLYYSNLDKNLSKNDEIRIQIHVDNGEMRSYKFIVSDLENIVTLKPIIEITNMDLTLGNYGSIASKFRSDIEVTEKDIEDLLEQITSKYGNINGFQFQGFSYEADENYGNFVSIKEVLISDSLAITMFLAYSQDNNELIGLHFP